MGSVLFVGKCQFLLVKELFWKVRFDSLHLKLMLGKMTLDSWHLTVQVRGKKLSFQRQFPLNLLKLRWIHAVYIEPVCTVWTARTPVGAGAHFMIQKSDASAICESTHFPVTSSASLPPLAAMKHIKKCVAEWNLNIFYVLRRWRLK